MPVLDVDGGLTFQGYNPRILTGRLPAREKPFFFGGSQIPSSLGLSKSEITTKVSKKLPFIRK
jgi:hypothetical protein